jgi:putative isomerase
VGPRQLRMATPGRDVDVFTTTEHRDDFYVETVTPYLALTVEGPVGISTGTRRSVEQIRQLIDARRADLDNEAAAFGDLAEAYLAVQSGIAWNTIYEPRHDRVVSTVGRLWNAEYGGYCLFGWDNFFLAYITAMSDRELGLANVIEHLRGATAEGFVPNDNRGNGSKSFDRSQPPVGSIMVREILKIYPERWFLEAVFESLLSWNRWWERGRLNDGLLSYGSHQAPNPFLEPAVRTRRTAGYESGMDDSPMYEDVPFNTEKNVLELQDVGLTSLVIADSLALAEMAAILGRGEEREELEDRARTLSTALDRLWNREIGLYLNRHSDTGLQSERLSPTLFYPLIAGVPDADRATRMVEEHLLNPREFWGTWVIPSIARSDAAFPSQRYWKGAIWPPLNFLTYLGLRRSGFPDVAAEVADKSHELFLREWSRQGYVSENYSAITGTGDDDRLSSDRFHSWGALMGVMAFVETGVLPPPEQTLEMGWEE